MKLIDKNQTLQPPEKYKLISVAAEGSYLRATYESYRGVINVDNGIVTMYQTVDVYLNDMGREVLRVEEDHRQFGPDPTPEKRPRTWWDRLTSWWTNPEPCAEM